MNENEQKELSDMLKVRPSRIVLSQHIAGLVELRDAIYDGSWETMAEELTLLKESHPPIYHRLIKRIEVDLDLIRVLAVYEDRYGINLRDEAISRVPAFPIQKSDLEPLYKTKTA